MGRRGRRREKKRPSGCVYGDRVDCDDVQSHECYSATNQRDCCDTCDEFRVTENDTGCQFGDRIADCPEDKPWRCYDNKYRDDCCFTCGNLYTSVQGCEYGDRVGNCLADECNVYTSSRRHDCCGSCPPPTTPNYTTTPSTQTYTGDSARNDQSPDWVAPVVGSIGGFLLIAILIAVFFWWRKRKGEPQNLSPIDQKMYNDYKMSKRPPMALPRDQSLPEDKTNKTSLTRENSAEYAYINPEEVTRSSPSEIRRSETDPFPSPTPGPTEYLHLGDADKYGYLEPIGTTVNGARSPTAPDRQDYSVQYRNEQSGPHRLNTYQKLPADKSRDVASHPYSHLQSEKM